MKNIISICCFIIFGSINAQTNDIFYKEDNSFNNIKSTSDKTVDKRKIYSETNSIISFTSQKKPFFLTGLSSQPIFEDGNDRLSYYNSIYEFDESANELNNISLEFKDVLYPSRVINDTIIEAKSSSKTYYIYKNGFEYDQISQMPIEFNENYLNSVSFYFSKYKNDPSIQNAITCYSESKIKKYNWMNEFDKQDYVNLLSQKILKSSNSYKIDNYNSTSLYKEYYASFDTYNFSSNTYKFKLEVLLKVSSFFNNDFDSTFYFKYSNQYRSNPFEFKCDETIARQIANLLNSERKVYLRIELNPANSGNLCNCNYCNYENKFFIKTLLVSSTQNFNENDVVRLNFE